MIPYFDVSKPSGPAGPVITVHPANITNDIGQTVNFTITATGVTSYVWQMRTGLNNGWVNVGTSSDTFTFGPMAASDNGNQFRCTVSDGVTNITSNIATLTVNMPAGNSREMAQFDVEILASITPDFTVTQLDIEPYGWFYPDLVATQLDIEPYGWIYPDVVVTQLDIEVYGRTV